MVRVVLRPRHPDSPDPIRWYVLFPCYGAGIVLVGSAQLLRTASETSRFLESGSTLTVLARVLLATLVAWSVLAYRRAVAP